MDPRIARTDTQSLHSLCVWLWSCGVPVSCGFHFGAKPVDLTDCALVREPSWWHAIWTLPNNCTQSKYLQRLSLSPSNSLITLETTTKTILAVRQNNMQNINFEFRGNVICPFLPPSLSEKQSYNCVCSHCWLEWGWSWLHSLPEDLVFGSCWLCCDFE